MITYVLYSVGLVPLLLNTIKDKIDNKVVDALKNAGMSYAAITVYIGGGHNYVFYMFLIIAAMLIGRFRANVFGTGDITALYWILPTLALLSIWSPIIFLCLFIFGVALMGQFFKPPFEGYIPIFVAYLVTGMFTIWGIFP